MRTRCSEDVSDMLDDVRNCEPQVAEHGMSLVLGGEQTLREITTTIEVVLSPPNDTDDQ